MNRRNFLSGSAAACLAIALPGVSEAVPPDPFMASTGTPVFKVGPLAENRVAAYFGTTAGLSGPWNIPLDGADGTYSLSGLTGKIRLVSLWAEGFWPCLWELNDLAALQSLYGDDRFEIMALLTGSQGRLSYTQAKPIMAAIGADNIRLWVEPKGGQQVQTALATMAAPLPVVPNAPVDTGLHAVLPCTLLIDSAGLVRGRVLGGRSGLKKNAVREGWKVPIDLTSFGLVAEPAQRRPTIWTWADADTFIDALKAGALN